MYPHLLLPESSRPTFMRGPTHMVEALDVCPRTPQHTGSYPGPMLPALVNDAGRAVRRDNLTIGRCLGVGETGHRGIGDNASSTPAAASVWNSFFGVVHARASGRQRVLPVAAREAGPGAEARPAAAAGLPRSGPESRHRGPATPPSSRPACSFRFTLLFGAHRPRLRAASSVCSLQLRSSDATEWRPWEGVASMSRLSAVFRKANRYWG